MNSSNSTTDKTERLKDTAALTKQWETIDWKNVEKQVNRLQVRIAKATVRGDRDVTQIYKYQKIHSPMKDISSREGFD